MRLHLNVVSFGLLVIPQVAAIVGGIPAQVAEFPYAASLRYMGSRICGATLINSQQLLTAAMCVSDFPSSSLSIWIDSIQRRPQGIVIQIEQVRVHPDYDSATLANNIAILDLVQPVSRDDAFLAFLPPPSQVLPAGDPVTLFGYGTTSEGGPLSSVLRYADVEVIDHTECQQAYSGALEIFADQFCDGVAGGGKGSCQGDWGGPVMQGLAVVGVISQGLGCARPGYPDITTSVSAHLDWIGENAI